MNDQLLKIGVSYSFSNVIRKRPKRLSDAGLKIEEVAREGTLRVREEDGYRCVPFLEIVK